jgi:predicted transposase/invertase (TIGR01784 family)
MDTIGDGPTADGQQFELPQPHDHLVRHFLASPDIAADLLQNYVPSDIVGLLDLARLRCESPDAVDKELREVIGDIRFSTRFRDRGLRAEVLVFLEHQSKADRLIRFRVLEYIVKACRKRLAEGNAAKGAPKTLPYVVAVVLGGKHQPIRRLPASS